MIAAYTNCCPYGERKVSAWELWTIQQQLSKTVNDPNFTLVTSSGIPFCNICKMLYCTHMYPPLPIEAFVK